MQRVPVSSSNIASIGYDEAAKTLEIEFHTGSVYQYLNVPIEIYRGLLKAGSPGGYFRNHVKGRFTTIQL